VVLEKRFAAARRRAAVAVVGVLTLVSIGFMPTPASAAPTFHRVSIGTALVINNQVFFAAQQGPMCLDDASGASGASHAQANTWDCGAQNSDLQWTLEPDSSGDNFILWSNKSVGCLDDWNGAKDNWSVVKMNGPSCSLGNANQSWSFWTDGTSFYLAPSAKWTGQVLSISGTPANGSLMIMWRAGTSNDQLVAL
jgi:hypothetical protein